VPFQSEDLYQLSRQALLRPAGDGLLAEGPLGGAGLLLSNASRLRLVLAFLTPARPADLIAGLKERQQAALLSFFGHCHRLGLLTRIEEDGETEESKGPLAHWEPHDLHFHLRSRRGRNGAAVGATFHLEAAGPPEPACKPAVGECLPLPRSRHHPGAEPTLTQALEARRSRYGVEPLSLDALGELLYRTCRATGETVEGGERFLRKLYPSGGSLHALEVYVIPARCEGIAPGVYRYLAVEHSLERAGEPGPELDLLLVEARQGTGGELAAHPPVLLVVTARVFRVTRKYQSLAYSLILKEVGALFQTIYLVAAAMGLAACAIGTGDSDRFARAAGLDFYTEASVGELILGGVPP
jgi:SagB-type dehydrogenase family enzyme